MPLKSVLDSLDDVPEALRELYAQDGDRYVLDLDEVDAHPGVRNLKSAFEREKEDRRKAREQLRALEAKLGEVADLDPQEAREALNKLREIEDKKLLDGGQVEEVVNRRTERMKQDYEQRLTKMQAALEELTGDRDGLRRSLEEVVIDNGLREAAAKKSVRPSAIRDALGRLKPMFRVVEGKPVAMDGEQVLYGRDGKSPLTMEEAVEGLIGEAPHLFEPSVGAGMNGGRPSGGPRPAMSLRDSASISANLEDVAAGKFAFTAD